VASQLSSDDDGESRGRYSTQSTIRDVKRKGPRPVSSVFGRASRGRCFVDSQAGCSDDDSDEESYESGTDSGAGSQVSQVSGPAPKKAKSRRAKRDGRCRNWVFTRNNWSDADVERFDGLVGAVSGCVYVCFQGEIGSDGRTPHLQGCVCFRNGRSMRGVQTVLGGHCHVERMVGTIHQARAYCCKLSSRDPDGPQFREHGELPAGAGAGRGSRTDCAALVADIKAGASPRTIAETHPALAVRCPNGVDRIRSIFAERRTAPTMFYWYYGPTGSGKSRAAAEEGGVEAYWKEADSIWWCGYEGSEDVIIDDYRSGSALSFRFLLRLGDRTPLSLQVKGGHRNIRAKRVFITTPKSPEETFSRENECLGQLYRRCAVVKEFKMDGEPVVHYREGDVYVPCVNVNVHGFVPNV